MAPDGKRLAGAQSLSGLGFALLLCAVVSVDLFVLNAGLVVIDLANGRHLAKALIGYVLPLVFGISTIVMPQLTM